MREKPILLAQRLPDRCTCCSPSCRLYWMLNMSFKTNSEIVGTPGAVAARIHAASTTQPSSPIRPGIRATSTR